jgi:PelA/Pel-15E family pectate lyase
MGMRLGLRLSFVFAVLCGVVCERCLTAQDDLPARARAGLLRAGTYWSGTVASYGGYVWEYSTDLTTRRRGESRDLPPTTNWVQTATPTVGRAFLHCYAATGEKVFLDAALAAGHCLAYGQLESGGWDYSIEHDPARVKHWYHHLGEKGSKLANTSTFDDDNTQCATRFLIELDRCVDDPQVSEAIRRALDCFLQAQYKEALWDGAWPQRYPAPKGQYGELPTFNDNTMADCVKTLLLAWDTYGRDEHLAAVRRCLEFYLRAQMAPPQAGWAQQVDRELKPAWARRFEPPAVCTAESRGNCNLLLDLYERFGDRRCLEAVGRCVDWYTSSRLSSDGKEGLWARFYEVGSNRPLYFTRTYQLTYKDDDLPIHYSFKGEFGIGALIRRYQALSATGATPPPTPAANRTREQWRALAEKAEPQVKTVLAGLDEQGRWAKSVPRTEETRDAEGRVGKSVDKEHPLDMMYTSTLVANLRVLAEYVTACNGGPAVSIPTRLPWPP